MAIIRPPPVTAVVGMPTGEKESGQRVDFKADKFSVLIETKGYRVAWSRACMCPCKSPATQSTQADPTCTLCGGDGFLYFRPKDYAVPNVAGKLDVVQQSLLDSTRSVIIRAVITSVSKNVSAYDKLGWWMFGSAMCTVRPENRLGYYDRIILIDAVAAHTRIVDVTDTGADIPLHYPVVDVNLMIDENGNRYVSGEDIQITDAGKIQFIPGREGPAGRYAVHFHYHPEFLVLEHTHIARESLAKFKKPVDQLNSPLGDHQPLPIQALIRLDHLIGRDSQEV